MPAFDRTGPAGMGPMTGRGMGSCAVPAGRQGMGFGWRRGMRRGRRYQPTKQDLEDYKKSLEEELKDVEKELADTQNQE